MLLNYVIVEFPLSIAPPSRGHSFEWHQDRYEHDFGKISFSDWDVDPTSVLKGSPIKITATVQASTKTFYGYIHHTSHRRDSQSSQTDVFIIGASHVMKEARQHVYANTTASEVVKRIAKRYKFNYDVTPHGRVYPQISQTGVTDWELMKRLARQCGYTLRADGVNLYFKPLTEDYARLKAFAPYYSASFPGNPSIPTLYSIKPIIGDTLEFEDGYKAAAAVSGIDPKTGVKFSVVNPKAPSGARGSRTPDLFDRYEFGTSAQSFQAAKFEAQAVDELNSFPYRARVEIVGSPDLSVDMPIYIDNVDSEINGYWTVLSIEHYMREGKFTTFLTVGTDSLGSLEKYSSNEATFKSVAKDAVLTTTAKAQKPNTAIVLSKVANRLSDSPVTTISSTWVGSSSDLRSSSNGAVNKTIAVLGRQNAL